MRLFLTCEHGGNLIPASPRALRRVFRGRERLLASHRGWDPGALELAGALAARSGAPLVFSLTSRLVVDLNRSLDNPTLWSTVTGGLEDGLRRQILSEHYRPYRERVERELLAAAGRQRVVHISVHTFTPVIRGTRREVDIGLLFDPSRGLERRLAAAWRRGLERHLPRLRVRVNEPYKGTDDGLTTHLRARTGAERYAGIELEVNQRFARRGGPAWERLRAAIAESLVEAMDAISNDDVEVRRAGGRSSGNDRAR